MTHSGIRLTDMIKGDMHQTCPKKASIQVYVPLSYEIIKFSTTGPATHLAKLVPELVELCVVRSAIVVAKLVEHGVKHLLVGDEIVVAARAPQPQLHLHPLVDVEPQQPRVPRPNKEYTHAPPGRRGGSTGQSGGRTAIEAEEGGKG